MFYSERRENFTPKFKPEKRAELYEIEGLIGTAGIPNETDPRIKESLKRIATIAEKPENRERIIEELYGTPERKGLLERGIPEESTFRLALRRILEAGINLTLKSILIAKEIELIAGIKGINSRKDIEKIKDVYPNIPINKIAKDLKIGRNEVYPIINILANQSDRQKMILKMLYDTRIEKGKKITISGIGKSLGINAGSDFVSSELLRYMGLVELNEKKQIVKINKEKFKEIYQDIETWSLKKEEIEKKKPERARRGERMTQAIQIIAENIKEAGINEEKISEKMIEEFIKKLSMIDFKIRGIAFPRKQMTHFKHALLEKIEKGKLMPEIKNYIERSGKNLPKGA